ncbi:hypothetical protein D3C86_1981620 [compost metagenome]
MIHLQARQTLRLVGFPIEADALTRATEQIADLFKRMSFQTKTDGQVPFVESFVRGLFHRCIQPFDFFVSHVHRRLRVSYYYSLPMLAIGVTLAVY